MDLYCVICDRDHTTDPSLILARWQNQTICTNCVENRPGREDAEAEARGEATPTGSAPRNHTLDAFVVEGEMVTCRHCDCATPKATAVPNRTGDCWIGACCWEDYWQADHD